jgi:hypothetical protein
MLKSMPATVRDRIEEQARREAAAEVLATFQQKTGRHGQKRARCSSVGLRAP